MSSEEISTFVVLDLETNGLPAHQFNKCSITEISVYAFSAKCLIDKNFDKTIKSMIELPRVLHKMTLMMNPRCMIDPSAERTTGLSNEMLENESPFDENTANCLNLFLERLEQPVCLVAHNGWSFDYPILRYVIGKLKMSLPSSVYCVDSLKAFREIDEKSEEIEKNKNNTTVLESDDNGEQKQIQLPMIDTIEVSNTAFNDPLEQNAKINWKLKNETTPQRKTCMAKKDDTILNLTPTNSHAVKRSVSLSVRRALFADDFKPKTKYPPRGVYKLGKIYKRCFNQDPTNLHRAESDVEILTKLILHYGLDFLAYAEERKEPFTKVPKLGSSH